VKEWELEAKPMC